MGEQVFDWTEATVIEEDDLGDYILQVGDDGQGGTFIRSYSVQVKPAGFDYDGLSKYLGDEFVYYVFSEEKVEELRSAEKSPHVRAQQKASISKDYVRDGLLGEFLLFLLTDAFLDIPMISHKLQFKQNYDHEVYGSDNLFFGRFDGQECIGIGEAKVKSGTNTDGIRDAVDSISDFHDPNSEQYMSQEISIAPKNLTSNLDEDQVDVLVDALTDSDYSNYPILHPIFVCYDVEDLNKVERVEKTVDEMKEEIEETLKEEEYLDKVQTQVENGHDRITRAYLLFFFLPVPDLTEFRKRMLTGIDPGLKHIMEQENGDEEGDKENKS